MRPLGLPTWSDKLVAEVVRLLLDAYYEPQFSPTRGPIKALVAVEHAILIAAWHMLTNGEFYRDLGPDYYTRQDPARAKARAVKQLEALGFQVTIEPLPKAG